MKGGGERLSMGKGTEPQFFREAVGTGHVGGMYMGACVKKEEGVVFGGGRKVKARRGRERKGGKGEVGVMLEGRKKDEVEFVGEKRVRGGDEGGDGRRGGVGKRRKGSVGEEGGKRWQCTVDDLLKEEPIGFPWFERDTEVALDTDYERWLLNVAKKNPRMTGVQAMRRGKSGEEELLVEWDPTPENGNKFTWEPYVSVPLAIRDMFHFQQRKRLRDGLVMRMKERANQMGGRTERLSAKEEEQLQKLEDEQRPQNHNRKYGQIDRTTIVIN